MRYHYYKSRTRKDIGIKICKMMATLILITSKTGGFLKEVKWHETFEKDTHVSTEFAVNIYYQYTIFIMKGKSLWNTKINAENMSSKLKITYQYETSSLKENYSPTKRSHRFSVCRRTSSCIYLSIFDRWYQ